MARTRADLGAGVRLTDLVSFGVISKEFPLARVQEALADTGKQSQRRRLLPAHVVVYYVIALSLYMQVSCPEVLRCLLEGLRWLHGQEIPAIPLAGESGISQARSRLGSEPLRQLHDALVRPIATPRTRGAWYRHWQLVNLDGSTLDVPDTQANAPVFGRQSTWRGRAAFPQIRLVSLVENGTHVLFGSQWGPYGTSERTLATAAIERLQPGMLCLADRGFYGFKLWQAARQTGADLLWRVQKNLQLPVEKRLEDGSFLTRVYPNAAARSRQRHGIPVRVIEYQLPGLDQAAPVYRVITTILDEEQAPAAELAALYHERWEIGVSSQGHIIQSVQDRPRLIGSGLVAWEAPWRESKAAKPSDTLLGKEYMQRTRLQRAVNAEVASLHAIPVAETVDNARKQQEWPKRARYGPSHRRGISGDMVRRMMSQLEKPSVPGEESSSRRWLL